MRHWHTRNSGAGRMFKKAVTVLMLLAIPFAQARAVLVCPMMDGRIVAHCECPHEADDGAPNRHDASDAACCVVGVEIRDDALAGIGADPKTTKQQGNDPIPDVLAAVHSPVAVATSTARAQPPDPSKLPATNPSRLYLLTARLRL